MRIIRKMRANRPPARKQALDAAMTIACLRACDNDQRNPNRGVRDRAMIALAWEMRLNIRDVVRMDLPELTLPPNRPNEATIYRRRLW